tara:strand:+ start:2413 stop:2790 length:378 start_codon:yes stop_codon:yes gene_type:complete
MGLFDQKSQLHDTILNHYDLGAGWYKRQLETRAITGSPFCRIFFLDPVGQMWLIDSDGTHDFSEEDGQFKWVKNGNRGRCKPFYFSGKVTVYPSKWDCYYAPYPECRLLFRNGILEVVTHIKKYV